MWTFTLDSDRHLTVFRSSTIMFEGSPEAFDAEAGVDFPLPPGDVTLAIQLRVEDHDRAEDERAHAEFDRHVDDACKHVDADD